jgi:hypothetical protein
MSSRFLFVLVALAALNGCASADKTPIYSPTPMAPGYPQSGYAPPPPAEPARDTTSSSVRSEEKGKGLFDKDEPSPKTEAKKVAMADPPPPTAPAQAGQTSQQQQPGPAPPQQPPAAQPQAVPPGAPVAKGDPTREPAQTRDLVIYTARFSMAVYQVDQGLSAVEKIARDNGGYLGQKKDREITIRIPRGRFEPTLIAIDKIGDVLHRDIQAQDVTDEHVDLEIRIKNARAMQKRLSDLLVKASVKDALEIEKELHRVTEELERLEGRMKVLKDKVAFSTITVAFEPRGASIQTARVRLPFPWLGGLNLPSLLSLSENKEDK